MRAEKFCHAKDFLKTSIFLKKTFLLVFSGRGSNGITHVSPRRRRRNNRDDEEEEDEDYNDLRGGGRRG